MFWGKYKTYFTNSGEEMNDLLMALCVKVMDCHSTEFGSKALVCLMLRPQIINVISLKTM